MLYFPTSVTSLSPAIGLQTGSEFLGLLGETRDLSLKELSGHIRDFSGKQLVVKSNSARLEYILTS